MQKVKLIIFSVLIISSCQRETTVETCYQFINDIDFEIVVEIYGRDSDLDGQRNFNEELLSTSRGLFFSRCEKDFSFLSPSIVLRSDSIVVKFDGVRRTISLAPNGPPTGLFARDSYDRQGNTLTKTFTQQDYDNAEPF